ncbi:MAG: NADH-quinone oxidoreductase subunit NuoE [Candidatus Hydrogenedentota bacterium]
MSILRDEDKDRIQGFCSIFPEKRSALLMILHYLQDNYSYVSDEIILELSEVLNIPATEMHNTFQFYTMLKKKKQGKYVIEVCATLSCSLMGSDHIIDYLENRLGIKSGETTQDGKFTLLKVECLGNCGKAPVMQINGKFYEELNENKIDKILKEIEDND